MIPASWQSKVWHARAQSLKLSLRLFIRHFRPPLSLSCSSRISALASRVRAEQAELLRSPRNFNGGPVYPGKQLRVVITRFHRGRAARGRDNGTSF